MPEFEPLSIGSAARIWPRESGRPVRLTSRGRRRRTTGRYMSVKVGQPLPWESRNELHAFWRAEVDTNVTSYSAQPHTLEVIVDGRRLIYTPDRQDILADGAVEIIEVKDRFEEDRDPDYTQKLEIAKALYSQVGWTFRIQEKETIESQPTFAAIKEIQAYARTSVSTEQIVRLQEALEREKAISIAHAVSLIGASSAHPLYALVVRRIIRIDISSGLSGESSVEALAP